MKEANVVIPVPKIKTNHSTQEIVISNNLDWGNGKTWRLEFSFPANSQVTPAPEAWLVISLLPAMRSGQDLEITQPVSSRLLANIAQVQAIFNQWDPAFKKIQVRAAPRIEKAYPASKDRKAACFFTGGVDSFYTILKHPDKIDTLIYLDNPFAGESGRARMNGKIEEAARDLGKSLIIVKSNFREFLDSYVDWDFSHGAAIITLAHLLSPCLSEVYIASGRTFSNIGPNGTHPMLDPLWSSEDLRVIHHGDAATRQEKIDFVAQNPTVLRTLRVCWENIEDELNCGRCYKCLHTMVGLRAAGKLDQSTAFARPLDLEFLARADFPKLISRYYLVESLEKLEKLDADQPLQTAIRQCLANQKMPPQLKQVAGTDPAVFELHQEIAYYKQALRYQIADRINDILGKNKVIHRAGDALAHTLWKIIK